MKRRSNRSRDTLAVALRRPSLEEMVSGRVSEMVKSNVRFTQIFVPGDVANIRHRDAIEDDGHIRRGTFITWSFAGPIDGACLMKHSGTESECGQRKGQDGKTED